jgi:transcriptional regulator with XRE-family HTH domain
MRVTIKAARINKNLTQSAFAKAIGVGVRTVQNWETGASSPRADKMPEICKVLGCETNDIIFLPTNCG